MKPAAAPLPELDGLGNDPEPPQFGGTGASRPAYFFSTAFMAPSSASRPAMIELWGDAQAASWLARGRL